MGSSMTQELSHKPPPSPSLLPILPPLSVMCMENVLSRGGGKGRWWPGLLGGLYGGGNL